MKLYYYEYETCVFRPMFNRLGKPDTEYDLQQGFLIESPLGVLHLFEDNDEIVQFNSILDFMKDIENRYPKNWDIVELK